MPDSLLPLAIAAAYLGLVNLLTYILFAFDKPRRVGYLALLVLAFEQFRAHGKHAQNHFAAVRHRRLQTRRGRERQAGLLMEVGKQFNLFTRELPYRHFVAVHCEKFPSNGTLGFPL